MTSPEHSSEDEELQRLPLVPLSECPTELYVPKYDYVAEFARQRRPGFDERAFVEELGLDYDEMQAAFKIVRPQPLPSLEEVSAGFENAKAASGRLEAFLSDGATPEEAKENAEKHRAAMKALGYDPDQIELAYGPEAVADELGKAAGPIGKLVEQEIKDVLSGADDPFSRDRRIELDPKRLKEISEQAAAELRKKGIDPDEMESFLLNNTARNPQISDVFMGGNPAIISAILGGLGDAIAKAEGWDVEGAREEDLDRKDLKEREQN